MWLAGVHGNAERNLRLDCRPSKHAPRLILSSRC